MPKDLQTLVNKAKKAAVPSAPDQSKKPVVAKEAATDFKDTAEGPDELVQKHAEEKRAKEILEDRDRRVNEGMDLLFSAADSILSASQCRDHA